MGAQNQIERSYESSSLSGARRKQLNDARRLADFGYHPVGETAQAVNPDPPVAGLIYRLVIIYRR